jgi:hypothetical protein
MQKKGQPIHVLSNKEGEAAQIAAALSETMGADTVRLVEHAKEGNGGADVPILVSPLYEMCFTYIRAKLTGPEESDALEEMLLKTAAIGVNLVPEENLTPCQISGPGEVLLGTVSVRRFLMLYGSVTEFEEGKSLT